MSTLALDLIAEAKHTRATRLDLGNCGLTELPDELFELSWLEELIICESGWEYYYKVNEWKTFETKNSGKPNNLISISPNLIFLKRLKQILINDQKNLDNLSALSGLIELEYCNAYDTKVSDLSPFKGLVNLKELRIWETRIVNLDPIKDLTNLQGLYISETLVKDLKPLKGLLNLQGLNISNTLVRDLSPLKDLSNLQGLYVDSTNVINLNALKDLSNLQELRINGNELSDLRPLKGLSNLQGLKISNTQVSDLSPLKDLSNLQELNISGTKIGDLSSLKGLSNLQALDISNTQISDLNPIKGLANLQGLKIFNTQVSDLSPLKDLSNLQEVNASNTRVSDLSPLKMIIERGVKVIWGNYSWSEEKSINIRDCPLNNPPKEIVDQGNEAILAYWRQIDEQGGTEELYEAKMIIVGEGKTGKTTLFNKLQNPDLDILQHPTEETHGINILEGWKIEHKKLGKQLFHAHIWDFCGQELQYMTHQFFLTSRALYVLMMDARSESPNLPYWLKIMSLLGKDESDNNDKVRLLLVFNKKENSLGNAPQYQDILKYYADDFDETYFEVNLAQNDLRFKSLKQFIQDSLISLPIVKSKLPRLWKAVRNALKERSNADNYISQKEFAQICNRIGIKNYEDQELLSGYLHKLGSILHFQEDTDLMDTIFLSPQWVVSGVYAVLENIDYLKAKRGRFTAQYILETLRKKGYDVTDAQKILQLMTKDKFDICYESTKDNYVAAQLLPDDAPKYKWENHIGSLKFRYQYPIMPKGLMSRLIVRLSEYIELNEKNEETVWKKGTVLKMQFEDINSKICYILLQEDDAESKEGLRQITIEVVGNENYRRDALRRVRDEVEKIHRQWFKNIQFDEMIPCNCLECHRQPKPELYKLKDLLRLQIKRTHRQCNSGEEVSIISLLEGIYTKEELERKEQKQEILLKEREKENIKAQENFDTHLNKQRPFRELHSKDEKEKNNQKLSFIEKMKNQFWIPILISIVLVAIFLTWAKPGSEVDFFGWFKAKQGTDIPIEKKTDVTSEQIVVTVIGSLKINNKNAWSEDVKRVYIKGQTLGGQNTLNTNGFILRDVSVKSDRIIEIAIDLKGKDNLSHSAMFKLPTPDKDKVSDIGEVLIEVKPPAKKQNGRASAPQFVIVNQNIQNY